MEENIDLNIEEQEEAANAEIGFIVVKNLDGTYKILESIEYKIIASRKTSRLDIKLAAGEIYNSISNAETAEAVASLMTRSQHTQDQQSTDQE